jgi:hypothetical protein
LNLKEEKEISNFALGICQNIYNFSVIVSTTPAPTNLTDLLLDLPPNDQGKSAIAEYTEITWEIIESLEKTITNTKAYLDNIPDLEEQTLEPYKEAFDNLPNIQQQLDEANETIVKAETYLALDGKKLKNIMDEGDPNNGVDPHADYIEMPNNLDLKDLIE